MTIQNVRLWAKCYDLTAAWEYDLIGAQGFLLPLVPSVVAELVGLLQIIDTEKYISNYYELLHFCPFFTCIRKKPRFNGMPHNYVLLYYILFYLTQKPKDHKNIKDAIISIIIHLLRKNIRPAIHLAAY